MPSAFERAQARLNTRFGGRAGRDQPTLGELQEREAELQLMVNETGARQPEQDQPGFFRRTIDVLSGFNYAVAGATEELATGKGLGAALSRATRELLSSAQSLPFGGFGLEALAGPIEGDKRAFGEVFERLGFKTTTMLDVLPALEGTFLEGAAKFINTRGTIGLIGDIAADPLTYVTFGLGGAARRTFTKAGTKFLTKKGDKVFRAELKTIREKAGLLGKQTDEATEQAMRDQALESIITRGDDVMHHGGLRFMGLTVPGTPGLGRAFSAKIINTANKFPFGRKTLERGQEFWHGVKADFRSVFSSNERLGELPESMRDAMANIAEKTKGTSTLLKLRLKHRVSKEPWRKVLDDPDSYRKIAAHIEGTGSEVLTKAEMEASTGLRELLQELGNDAVESGVLEAGQVKGNYFYHFYENSPEDFSEVWNAWKGQFPEVAGKHDQSKKFATHEEAIRISTGLNKVSKAMRAKGHTVPIYPILKPDYNAGKGLSRYIDWYVETKTRRMLFEDTKALFGKDIDFKRGMRAVFNIGRKVDGVSEEDGLKIAKWFGDREPLATSDMVQQVGDDLVKSKDVRAGREVLRRLSPEGKREFFRREFLLLGDAAAKSKDGMFGPKALFNFLEKWKDWDEFMPRPLMNLDGELEDSLKIFGESAQYTTRGGGNSTWGDKPIIIPELIADFVDAADPKLLNSKDFKAFRKNLQRWDTMNNLFKVGVYALWPASAFRDMYSNLAFMAMRIGWHALDPSLYKHSVNILANLDDAGRLAPRLAGDMAGGFRTKSGRFISYQSAAEDAVKHNVTFRAEQFAELTGDTHRITNTPGLKQALKLREKLENSQRLALFMQGKIDDLSSADAASTVAEFLFNYNSIPAFQREVLRRMFPFVTFTLKNVELHAKMLRRHPGMVINQLKPFRGREGENKAMIKWEGEALKMRMESDGKTVSMLTGIDLPLRNLDVLWRGEIRSTLRGMAGMLTPPIKVGLETALGREFFTGKGTERATSPAFGRAIEALNTPKAVKDWLGYDKSYDDAGRPRYSFDGERFGLLWRSWMFSRFISTSDRQFREYAADSNWSASMLDILTGVRSKKLNLDEQQRIIMQRRIKQLEESLVRRGEFRSFSKAFQPKERGQPQ